MALVSHINQETLRYGGKYFEAAGLELEPVTVIRFLKSRHVAEVETISLNAVALLLPCNDMFSNYQNVKCPRPINFDV